MILDPVAALRDLVRGFISAGGKLVDVDAQISPRIPWRPHLYEPHGTRAWHLIAEAPPSDAWLRRIEKAQLAMPDLQVSVAIPLPLLQDEILIEAIDALDAEVLPILSAAGGQAKVGEMRHSVLDLIYEQEWWLSHSLTSRLLDKALERALAAQGSYEKGARLEVLCAVMLSQVNGFEVNGRNISSANQEIDITILNRNTAGPLSRGQYVLVECKNWKDPVPRKEYNAFGTKLRTRHGMAKLGFMVTTNRFESGCYVEHIGERYLDDLIVLLDEDRLPSIWRDYPTITSGVEAMVTNAVYDHELA